MDFKELTWQRYSLRKMADTPIEEEKLNLIFEAARSAPTAKNFQPQKLFVIKSKESLEKINECTPCHFGAPVVIVVAYDSKISWHRENDGKDHGEIDAAIVATEIMLQAADLGLNTTYVGMFDKEKLLETFPEMQGTNPIALLPLGYPQEGAHPSRLHLDRKPIEEMVVTL